MITLQSTAQRQSSCYSWSWKVELFCPLQAQREPEELELGCCTCGNGPPAPCLPRDTQCHERPLPAPLPAPRWPPAAPGPRGAPGSPAAHPFSGSRLVRAARRGPARWLHFCRDTPASVAGEGYSSGEKHFLLVTGLEMERLNEPAVSAELAHG